MKWTVALSTPLDLPGPPGRGHRIAWGALCGLLVALIAFVDHRTGYELNLSLLYLATVCLATWMLGRTAGIVFALAAVTAWLVADIFTARAYSHWLYRYWETVIRIVTWLGFALLLDKLRTALARADERFVTVLARLDAAVYVADAETGDLLYVNEGCREAFGNELRNVSEIERRQASATAGPQPASEAAGAQREVQDAITGRWYLIAARAIRWIDGRAVGLYIATDVTDRKRAEELARQQQEKLEMTSRLTALGEMASTLAHEINQPLAAITYYCTGCVRRLRSGDWKRDDLLDALEKAAAQAERSAGIIQRVREFLRKRDPQVKPCDVNSVVEGMARTVAPDAERRGARLRLALEPGLPRALADSIQIEQVMLNLVKNALEAMHDADSGAREIDIRTAAGDGGRVTIEVADRGPGLPAQLRDNPFIPFYTTKAEGMGMGLHICRSIVERHGGRLTAAPNPAGGTVFRFTLPAAAP